MVIRQLDDETGAVQLIVRGNRSMSWRANVVLAASLGAVSAIFGGGIAWFGFWMILPFAGLEFLLVIFCLGKAYKKMGFTEVISLRVNSVVIETGYDKPDKTIELPRQWTKLEFNNPSSLFEMGTLKIMASGRSVELGRLLNKEEKRDLHRELQKELRMEIPKLRLIS